MSNKPHMFPAIQQSMSPETVNYFDGSNAGSFSRLINRCVSSTDTEIVIMMSDKVLPTSNDVKKCVELIHQGYGLVALYRFAFFGFKKELLRRIGMFDERFASGGYEDDDFYIRLKEANIGMYVSHEVNYTKGVSSWDYSVSEKHFFTKWGNPRETGVIKRYLPEEKLTYDLGPSVPATFVSWDQSCILTKKVKKYSQFPIVYN